MVSLDRRTLEEQERCRNRAFEKTCLLPLKELLGIHIGAPLQVYSRMLADYRDKDLPSTGFLSD